MNNSKANLKAAREAIGKKDFEEAIKCCNRITLWDSGNYNAYVFLGVAYAGLNNTEEAEKAYQHAIEINSEQLLAWQGLVSLYEKQDNYQAVLQTIDLILPKLISSNDGNRVAEYLNKKLDIYENKQPDESKFINTLKLFLPNSTYYDLIKNSSNLPSTTKIYTNLIMIAEKSATKAIESGFKDRRLRASASPNVTATTLLEQVEADVYSKSDLASLYETLLRQDDTSIDTQDVQVKLLELYRKQLPALPSKTDVYGKISNLVHSLVAQEVNNPLPYEISMEFTDVSRFDDYNQELIDILVNRFNSNGTSKIIQGYRKYNEGQIDEAFDLFGEGLELRPQSLCGYLCLCWIYHDSNEYETGLEYATRGRELVQKFIKDAGQPMEKMMLSMDLCMAHCYRQLDSKYHPDALDIYKRILTKSSDQIGALEGAGVILCEDRKYDEALTYFEKVLGLDPQQHMALAEIGWIYAQKQDYDKAIHYVSQAIELTLDKDVADYYYKLGRIYWMMEGNYRTDTNYAFKYFMLAVKRDSEFANGFAYLGHYYREIQGDHVRAKKCYQKAFLLNPLDVETALLLSDYYVADDDHTQAQDVFRQVANTNPKAGWAWRRLGYANMDSNDYEEAINCFQKALRNDTSNVRCWEGLGEAYAHEGRYVAALKAFERATTLDPLSINGNHQKALVKQKVGMLNVALSEFKATLLLAQEQGKGNYLPSLKGLADTYLECAKEDFQQGFFGRAVTGCGDVIQTCLQGLQVDPSILGFWKLIGDACCMYRSMPSYLHLCAYPALQLLMKDFAIKAHQTLGFNDDHCSQLVDEFVQLDVSQDDFYLPPQASLDVVLACASFAYKQVIVLCHNHRAISPAFWHDLSLVYYWVGENNLDHQESCTAVSTKCIQVALTLEPTQATYWNALGIITMKTSPKISQHAFIKAMEYNNRSAVPWTNYGFLCLSLKDYELANQAFETAHALDPEWINAWVGQAYVASVWGTEATAIFQHAFESSNGSALEASYGYANTVYRQLSNQQQTSTMANNTIVISPAFALQKLTEQRLNDASALNLLGLLSERLGQHQRAAEAFAGAILALEAKMEQSGMNGDEETTQRLAKLHANLGRTLCATGDFAGAIDNYQIALQQESMSSRIYCLLGAGIAHYFLDQLEEALHMFELALNETTTDVKLRQDVVVLLSKVLWALGGDEQRAVAKDQLLGCIADSPQYLPAIFSLCVMGILGNDSTLTTAALDELIKLPSDVAFDDDKEQWISWIFSRYHKLQGDDHHAIQSLLKNVHQLPWLASLWSRLGSEVVTDKDNINKRTLTSIALVMDRQQQSSTDSQAQNYENSAIVNQSQREAQRAIHIAPWRLQSWQSLITSNKQ
ncbi:uncharacterized protein BX664DRAFT_293076 [Halteromyces radiatus]|uniref:uncharacterized protein n=1 Tax=Halteromyces radiatus TaxID=101107 RepID=UPI00221E85A9|nr:uncharacterized protein BX664DRAFT_293076 [Halteromyces radiatus]KAI8097505.1 hypothetical protein BX664DRAFT_293076 [Halteromyces radiatus]